MSKISILNLKKDFLKKKFDALPYEFLRTYFDKERPPISFETLRRAVFHNEPIKPHILMLIMKHFGCSNAEIKKTLEEAGEEEYSSFLQEGSSSVTDGEKALIELFRLLKGKNPDSLKDIKAQLELISRVNGIEATEILRRVR
ncbi:MAG: hypothetical protein Unbinned7913contig1002_20 [Prokaryotic dsDNA virus sp.]|jgi:hypothetical protein|nr:hypothetical protein [Parcubacteria group bacterium]QDP51265.1 MAG: hypothetical protein Unbinned7913contig1002_20 [Prokaryotic dsDNA virus sp.]|tara:strand:- start:3105 stop:3533 length:429 start_codon:yes stop_codon:yes gene_type:complete